MKKLSYVSMFIAAATLLVTTSVSCQREIQGFESGYPSDGAIVFAPDLGQFSVENDGTGDIQSLGTRTANGAPQKFFLHGYSQQAPLSFSEKEGDVETKSAPVTVIHSTFKVSGYAFLGAWNDQNKANLFFGETMTKSGSTWTGEAQMVWPGADYNVRFGAVSPATATNLSWTSTALSEGMPAYSYTVADAVASQVDILECASSSYLGDGSTAGSGVALTFSHALTGVKFRTNDFGTAGTVKSVSIEGVYNSGSHVVGASSWTGQSGDADYSFPSINASFTASGESAVTDGANTLLLMPQTCPAGAKIVVSMTINGTDWNLEASIAGHVWEPGKLITYTISPSKDDWLFSLVDISGVAADVPDATATNVATVKSFRQHALGFKEALPWTYEFSTDGGETFSSTQPSWLTAFTPAGQAGGWAGEAISATTDTRTEGALPGASFGSLKGSSSSYVDLSMIHPLTRASVARETANCYIVDSPGYYKIPLFYGNAVVGGADNLSSAAPAKGGVTEKGDFVNAYNAVISDGNIKTDLEACGQTLNTSGGKLIWSTLNSSGAALVIVNSAIEVEGGVAYLKFQVPESGMKNGFAVVGVLKNGSTTEFIWSWLIWITGEGELFTETYTNASSVDIDMLNVGIGGSVGSSVGKVARSCIVKVSNSGDSKTFVVNQDQVVSSTTPNIQTTYYQWGTPIALPPSDGSTNATAALVYGDASYTFAAAASSAYTDLGGVISKPYAPLWNNNRQYGTTGSSHNNYYFYNQWDATQTVASTDKVVVKTVYDPCPAGMTVPRYAAYTYFSTTNKVGAFNKGWYFKKNSSDATGSFWPASGYRYSGASPSGVGSFGYWWSACADGSHGGHYLYFRSGYVSPQYGVNRYCGYSVRPALVAVP